MNINQIKQQTLDAVNASDTIVAVFHNNLNNCRYTFKNGKDAIFLGGVYTTKVESEIEELMEEIKQGHQHISIDENQITKDTKEVNILALAREQLIRELKEKGYLTSQGEADFGNSDQNIKMNITTSRDMNDAFSGYARTDDRVVVTTSQQVPTSVIQDELNGLPPSVPAPANVETVSAMNTIGIDPTEDQLASDANKEPVNAPVSTVVEKPVVTDDEGKLEKRTGIKVGPRA